MTSRKLRAVRRRIRKHRSSRVAAPPEVVAEVHAALQRRADAPAEQSRAQSAEVEEQIAQAVERELDDPLGRLADELREVQSEAERRMAEAIDVGLREEVEALRSSGEARLAKHSEALDREAEQRLAKHAIALERNLQVRLAKHAEELERHADEKSELDEAPRGEETEELGRLIEALDTRLVRLKQEVEALHSEMEERLAKRAEAEERIREEAELMHAQARSILAETEATGERLRELSEALYARHADLLGNPGESGAGPSPTDGGIDLNEATVGELCRLNLSRTQAARLVKYREEVGGFKSLDQLDALPGFSEKLRGRLKQRLTLKPGKAQRSRQTRHTASKPRAAQRD